MVRRAVCSGSFDPVTCGHIDIFERASRMVDELIICVFHNVNKQGFLPVGQRVALLEESVAHIENARVASFSGLLTDYMRSVDAHLIIRGVRSAADLDYEQREAAMNARLAPDIDTVLLMARPEYGFLSSSGGRELYRFNGDIHGLVPACVEQALIDRRKDVNSICQ